MAFDAYFKLEGGNAPPFKGESQSKGWEDFIEIKSFQLGAQNIASVGSSTGGASTGKVELQTLVIEKFPDQTSPILFLACAQGSHYETATLSLCKSGGTAKGAQQAYLTFEFNLVFVDTIEESGNSGDDVPDERLELKYGALRWTYRPQDKTGKLGAAVSKEWSQVINAESFET